MQDIRAVEVVRWVAPTERWEEVVLDARGETWASQREYALLQVERGFVLVRGGRDGIELEIDEAGRVVVLVDGEVHPVQRLAWHTHPIATGPSDQDRMVLKILGQAHSKLFEPRGSLKGIKFFADTKGGSL